MNNIERRTLQNNLDNKTEHFTPPKTDRALKISAFVFAGCLLLALGYLTYFERLAPPQIVYTPEPVYNLSQSPELMEVYANMLGKTLQNTVDIEAFQAKVDGKIRFWEQESEKRIKLLETESQYRINTQLRQAQQQIFAEREQLRTERLAFELRRAEYLDKKTPGR